MELKGDAMCFACGGENPIGLKLKFRWEGDRYRTEFIPGEEHQSYTGLMHGGLICTILDEVMGKLLYSRGINAVTARLEVRFRRPVAVGEKVIFRGEIVADKGKLIETRAEAATEDGTGLAAAKAVFMRV
ncbi:MAG: PaaI family thioesterase [bacterium]